MGQTSEDATGGAANAVPHAGDHDRVTMLSLRADGVPDQHNPEIIGDKEFAREATVRQFTEQAVSAEDVRLRGTGSVAGVEVEQDPHIARLADAHQSAADAATSAAESAVDELFTGETAEQQKQGPVGETPDELATAAAAGTPDSGADADATGKTSTTRRGSAKP